MQTNTATHSEQMEHTNKLSDFTTQDLLIEQDKATKTATHLNIVARSGMLSGDFSIMEGFMAPSELLTPHTHQNEDQVVYVIEGELEFEVGGDKGLHFTAKQGSYVIKPRGIEHSFWNKTDSTVRYMELSGRDGFEKFVDGHDDGTLKGQINGERNLGLNFNLKRIPKMLLKYKLKYIAALQLPWSKKEDDHK